MLVEIGMLLVFLILGLVMSLRIIEHDEHFGYIGLGAMTESAANAFSATIIDAIIEPDLIIKTGRGARSLDIDIDDVIVWDCKEWHFHNNQSPDIVGGEDLTESVQAGITKDNTVNGNDAPTADSAAQGTLPGGNGGSVTGANAGGPGTRTIGDEQPTRYVTRVFHWGQGAEEQTAVGQIIREFNQMAIVKNGRYRVDGNDVHYLLTAAHYHLWIEAQNLAAVSSEQLGMYTRRVAIDVEELMFDRAVIISILDALVVST